MGYVHENTESMKSELDAVKRLHRKFTKNLCPSWCDWDGCKSLEKKVIKASWILL